VAPTTYQTRETFFGAAVKIGDLDSTLSNDLLSAQAFIPLDICAFREVATNAIQNLAAHGGILASDSTPILERVNGATDRALRLKWVINDVAEIAHPPVPLPPDRDPAEDVIVHLLLARDGTTDDCDIDVLAFSNGVTGTTYAADTEMGGKTAALTADANIIVEATVTLTSTNVIGPPGMLTLSLLPDAHTTNIIYLYGAWIEFTRKLRTS